METVGNEDINGRAHHDLRMWLNVDTQSNLRTTLSSAYLVSHLPSGASQ